jgi:hypothetical protein
MFNAIADVSCESGKMTLPSFWTRSAVIIGSLAIGALAVVLMVGVRSKRDLGPHSFADSGPGEVLNIQRPSHPSASQPIVPQNPRPEAHPRVAPLARLAIRVSQSLDQTSRFATSPMGLEVASNDRARLLPAKASASPALPSPPGFTDDEKVWSETTLVRPVTVASAGNLTFWRLTSGGVIARSSDGVNWQPLNSGTSNDLLAGAAPSAEICWLVGRRGTVLRTIDGEQWQQTASPIAADLVGISAPNEYTATVSTADGRKFTTHNGGITWQAGGVDPDRLAGAM